MSILKTILDQKHREVSEAKATTPLEVIKTAAEQRSMLLELSAALRSAAITSAAVIAEIKRASPSKGDIAPWIKPVQIAKSYKDAGAAAISVLTDKQFFKGDLKFIPEIKREVDGIPVLRKEFIVDPYQLYESKAAGADAVLLIVAALTAEKLLQLYLIADEIGLEVLVEVHNEAELDQFVALLKGIGSSYFTPPLLGINNRDLNTFAVDLATTERLIGLLPSRLAAGGMKSVAEQLLIVTESGLFTAADLRRMHRAGATGFLIGESLLAQGDPGENLARLLADL